MISIPKKSVGLPKQETLRLVRLAQSGDKEAVDTLVSANEQFIKFAIWRAFGSRTKTPIPQFMGIATLTFIECIQTFKDGGAKLTSYSYNPIIQEVWSQSRLDRSLIHVPECSFKNKHAHLARLAWNRPKQLSAARTISVSHDFSGYERGVELRSLVSKFIKRLSYRERLVIQLRFFEDLTLEESGRSLNVSRERVRQLEARAIRKLTEAGLGYAAKDFL